jgi:hypothetical protein
MWSSIRKINFKTFKRLFKAIPYNCPEINTRAIRADLNHTKAIRKNNRKNA